MAYSYTKHQEDALDAVQNSVCKALESYEQLKNTDAMKTWLYRILINESLSILKKRQKVHLVSDYSGHEEAFYDNDPARHEAVQSELKRPEPDAQPIIKLRFFEDLPLKDVACITGLNLNTVKTKLYRSLKQLKENIQEAELWEN